MRNLCALLTNSVVGELCVDVGGANSVVVTVCFLVGLVWLLLREITVLGEQGSSDGDRQLGSGGEITVDLGFGFTGVVI